VKLKDLSRLKKRRDVDRDAEAHEAVAVRRGDMDERDVHREAGVLEQEGELEEGERDVVGGAGADGLARVGTAQRRVRDL